MLGAEDSAENKIDKSPSLGSSELWREDAEKVPLGEQTRILPEEGVGVLG